MTNWMWFVSGVIAGGLITGVSSFFIFKKKYGWHNFRLLYK